MAKHVETMDDNKFSSLYYDYVSCLTQYWHTMPGSARLSMNKNIRQTVKYLIAILGNKLDKQWINYIRRATGDFLRAYRDGYKNRQMWVRLFFVIVNLQRFLNGMHRDTDVFFDLKQHSGYFKDRLVTFLTNSGWIGEFNPFGTCCRHEILDAAAEKTKKPGALCIVNGTMITIPITRGHDAEMVAVEHY